MRIIGGAIVAAAAAMAIAAHGAALLEADGLVTGKSAGWRFEASGAKNGWPLWDMFTPAYDWLFKTGLPSGFYSCDYVHSGELGKQVIGRIALGYFVKSAEPR